MSLYIPVVNPTNPFFLFHLNHAPLRTKGGGIGPSAKHSESYETPILEHFLR